MLWLWWSRDIGKARPAQGSTIFFRPNYIVRKSNMVSVKELFHQVSVSLPGVQMLYSFHCCLIFKSRLSEILFAKFFTYKNGLIVFCLLKQNLTFSLSFNIDTCSGDFKTSKSVRQLDKGKPPIQLGMKVPGSFRFWSLQVTQDNLHNAFQQHWPSK